MRTIFQKILTLVMATTLLLAMPLAVLAEDAPDKMREESAGDADSEPDDEPTEEPDDTEISEGDFEFIKFPRGYVLSKYTGIGGDVVVPGEVRGKPVYAVDAEAFRYAVFLRSVILPDTVEAIGHDAFRGCSALERIQLPRSLWGVGLNAFNGCSSLREIEFPERTGYISGNAFDGCSALEKVWMPPNLYDIGPQAFRGCENLRVLEILGDTGTGAFIEEDKPFIDCVNLEQIFYGGTEAELCDLMTEEQIRWADSFLVSANRIAGDAILDTYLGDGGDIAVPAFLGEYRMRGFGDNVFSGVADAGRILYAGSGAQWEYIDKGEGNENALSNVVCLGSYDETSIPELTWDDEYIIGASFGNLDGFPLQGKSIVIGLEKGMQPGDGEDQPGDGEERPGDGEDQSGDGEEQPGDGEDQPGDGEESGGLPGTAAPPEVAAYWQEKSDDGDISYRYTFTDLEGNRLRSYDFLTTGAQVTRTWDSGKQTATVVVAGDISGSGTLTIAQLTRIAQILNGTAELEGAFLRAADINGNGQVDIQDLTQEAQWLTTLT